MQGLYVGLAILVLAIVGLGAMEAIVEAKMARIANAYPDAIVVRSGRTPSVATMIPRLHAAAGFDAASTPIPLYFALVFDNELVSLRGDVDTQFASLPWSIIESIRAETLQENGRFRSGITLSVKSTDGSLGLSFVVVGRGPFGAFSQRMNDLEQLVPQLDALRASSR